MNSLISIIDQGLIFSLVATAVYLTSRVIKKDDLTTEGSFGLGGAITAVITYHSLSPWLSVIASLCVGALAGFATGILCTRLKMHHLMAGLVTTTACFSIGLGTASANRVIHDGATIFSTSNAIPPTVWLLCMATIFLVMMKLILRSQIGLLLRTVGDNQAILIHLGKSKERYTIVGFVVANAITAVAGSLFVQWSGFFSITGNIGTLITGIATLMIAELFRKPLGILMLVAAIIYQSIFMVTLFVGIDPVWNNLVKAIIMILLMAISGPIFSRKLGEQRA